MGLPSENQRLHTLPAVIIKFFTLIYSTLFVENDSKKTTETTTTTTTDRQTDRQL